jgi:hypothetical protein
MENEGSVSVILIIVTSVLSIRRSLVVFWVGVNSSYAHKTLPFCVTLGHSGTH